MKTGRKWFNKMVRQPPFPIPGTWHGIVVTAVAPGETRCSGQHPRGIIDVLDESSAPITSLMIYSEMDIQKWQVLGPAVLIHYFAGKNYRRCDSVCNDPGCSLSDPRCHQCSSIFKIPSISSITIPFNVGIAIAIINHPHFQHLACPMIPADW